MVDLDLPPPKHRQLGHDLASSNRPSDHRPGLGRHHGPRPLERPDRAPQIVDLVDQRPRRAVLDLPGPLLGAARVALGRLTAEGGFEHPPVALGVPSQVGEDVADAPTRQQRWRSHVDRHRAVDPGVGVGQQALMSSGAPGDLLVERASIEGTIVHGGGPYRRVRGRWLGRSR